jgi:NAD+ kinase
VTAQRVALISHPRRKEALDLREQITQWLSERGIDISEREPDLVMALGGDGTVLRAAQLAHAADVPLLGINVGTLGYLTEVDAADAFDAIGRVLKGEYEVEPRMMLSCTTDQGTSHVGVNEVLVQRASPFRLITLKVRVDEQSLATFSADGVIVATPTGSTAYALSAGGPIVAPRTECLVLVPVNPHMVFSRAIVLPADESIEIIVDEEREKASLSLDGAVGSELPPGSRVTVGRHSRPLSMVRLTGPGFLERLRAKLRFSV